MALKVKFNGRIRRSTLKSRFARIIVVFNFTYLLLILLGAYLLYDASTTGHVREKVRRLEWEVEWLEKSQYEIAANLMSPVLHDGSTIVEDSSRHRFDMVAIGLTELKLNRKVDRSGYAAEMDELLTMVKESENLYISFLQNIRESGTHDSGILGNLRQIASDITSTLEMEADNRAIASFQKLRLIENDFILFPGPVILEKFEYQKSETESLLATSLAYSSFANYTTIFKELADKRKTLGFSPNEGLQYNLHSRLAEVQSRLIAFENHLVKSDKMKHRVMYSVAALTLLILGAILSFTLVSVTMGISKAFGEFKSFLLRLTRGELPQAVLDETRKDEIGEINQALNIQVAGLRETIKFAENLKSGVYDSPYQPLSENDNLGIALLEMRESLRKNYEESEKQKILDRQQVWVNKGLARVGEILNQNYKTLDDFAYNIISGLVKYLDACIGTIFFVNDDEHDRHLELKAGIAYDRRKYFKKTLAMGESLVGACALEKKYIFNKIVPHDYIQITSGLGDAPPNVILIAPLITDNVVYGVIEIATFRPMEQYQIEFVEHISALIANNISGAKIKEKTQKLYDATREQAEKIAQDEEEMRQNMEELQATQEESHRREHMLNEQLERANITIDKLKAELAALKGKD